MTKKTSLLDNDILLKLLLYKIETDVFADQPFDIQHWSVLRVSKFVIKSAIKKKAAPENVSEYANRLDKVIAQTLTEFEPTDNEIALAAELEKQATELDVDFDDAEGFCTNNGLSI